MVRETMRKTAQGKQLQAGDDTDVIQLDAATRHGKASTPWRV